MTRLQDSMAPWNLLLLLLPLLVTPALSRLGSGAGLDRLHPSAAGLNFEKFIDAWMTASPLTRNFEKYLEVGVHPAAEHGDFEKSKDLYEYEPNTQRSINSTSQEHSQSTWSEDHLSAIADKMFFDGIGADPPVPGKSQLQFTELLTSGFAAVADPAAAIFEKNGLQTQAQALEEF